MPGLIKCFECNFASCKPEAHSIDFLWFKLFKLYVGNPPDFQVFVPFYVLLPFDFLD